MNIKHIVMGTWICFAVSFLMILIMIAAAVQEPLIFAMFLWLAFWGIISLVLTFIGDARDEVERLLRED